MFDFGWGEMALTAAVAAIVIGPKELPRVMHTAGTWARKLRLLAGDFQHHMTDMLHEAELDELQKKAAAAAGVNLNEKMKNLLDPDQEIARGLEIVEPEETEPDLSRFEVDHSRFGSTEFYNRPDPAATRPRTRPKTRLSATPKAGWVTKPTTGIVFTGQAARPRPKPKARPTPPSAGGTD